MVNDRVEISIAVMNYDRDSQILNKALIEIEGFVHGKDDFVLSEPQFTFGWYFLTLSVCGQLLVKIANLLGNEFLNMEGKTFEKKFMNWLTAKLKERGCEMKLDLKSELETSKYGLF